MELSRERIQEMKDLLEKEGKIVTWEEASDATYRLAQLAELALDSYFEDQRRTKKLKESPKGFHLEGIGYTCFICGNSASNEETWYDKYGIKCLTCQKAIDKKIIPATAAKDKESWYSKYDLESRFNLNHHAVKRFIKQGILKPRIVPDDEGRPHVQIFLIKDNKDTLPPKKLTESEMVKVVKDGQEWHHLEPWYKFVNPHEHLKGYKIMDHLKVIHEEKKGNPVETKIPTMKINEVFKIGGIMQSIGGTAEYLDQNNCIVSNKTKTEDAVILHIKRDSDGEEGNVYLRVKDEFKDLKDGLLNWAFANTGIMGLTLNQLESFETDLVIEKSNGRLSFRKKS